MNVSKVNSGYLFFFLISISILTLFLPPFFFPIAGSILTIYFGEIFLWLCFVIWLVAVAKKRNFTLSCIGKYCLILIFIGILSLINTTNIGRYLIGLSTYIEVALIVLMFTDIVFNQKYQSKIIRYFKYSGCILSLFIISKTLFENNGDFILGNKITLNIGASNYLASILLLPFFISLTAIFNNKFSLKNLLLLLVIGVAIIFTASRTALFVAIVLSATYVILDVIINKNTRFTKKVFSLILILFGAGVIYYIGKDFLTEMIQSGRFDNLSEQSNLLSRFQIFQEYLDAFLNHPFVGNGFLNVNGLNEYYLAHNFILQVLGDNGFISLLIYIGLLITIYRYLNSRYNATTNIDLKSFILGYKRGFLAVLIHGMLEPNFGTKLFMIYIFIGLGIIIASTTGEERKIINMKRLPNQ
ncbi:MULTISPECIES: O-antigen ligase family protein [unclassified Peribacillus]|uniref:O-antigen ligase family protein n=1 Tax=unclassified Peribacillus TaxID=2675266 RepID=UPI00366FF3AA